MRIWNAEEMQKHEEAMKYPMIEHKCIELSPVDLKFNSLGSRVAVSSIDNSLKIFNILPKESQDD